MRKKRKKIGLVQEDFVKSALGMLKSRQCKESRRWWHTLKQRQALIHRSMRTLIFKVSPCKLLFTKDDSVSLARFFWAVRSFMLLLNEYMLHNLIFNALCRTELEIWWKVLPFTPSEIASCAIITFHTITGTSSHIYILLPLFCAPIVHCGQHCSWSEQICNGTGTSNTINCSRASITLLFKCINDYSMMLHMYIN